MKIVVTGTRTVPNLMGGVETHCEELFPSIAKRGMEKPVTLPSPKKKSFEAIRTYHI